MTLNINGVKAMKTDKLEIAIDKYIKIIRDNHRGTILSDLPDEIIIRLIQQCINCSGPPKSPMREAYDAVVREIEANWYAYHMARDDDDDDDDDDD